MTDRQKLAKVYEINQKLWELFQWLWGHNDMFPGHELYKIVEMEFQVQEISELTEEAYKSEQRMKNIDNILKELSDEENGLWATMVKITEDYKNNKLKT